MRSPGIPAESWTSKYGSVTFSAFGKDIPVGGINEAGLVMEPMGLPQSKHPPVDKTPRLHGGQWIQYALDSYSTVQEVLDNLNRVHPIGHNPHLLIADKTGDCAVLEYLEGRAVVYRGEDLPVRGISNATYADSMSALRQFVGFGEKSRSPQRAPIR